MDPVHIYYKPLTYTTNNEKTLASIKVCSTKNFQNDISGFVANFGRFAHINYELEVFFCAVE